MIGDFSLFQLTIIAFAVIGSAIIKNGVGIGAGIFMLPFLFLVFPPKFALGLGAPAMLVSDIVGVRNYWREWDKGELLLLVPPAVLGVLLGAMVIKVVPSHIFKLGVAVIAIIFSCYQLGKLILAERRRSDNPISKTDPPNRLLTVFFGFFGGIASAVIHAGGMVMSIYLIQRPVDKRQFVGTFIFFFAILNLLKLFTYLKIQILTGNVLILVALLSPVIIFGGMVGDMLNKRFSQRLFRVIVLLIILFIGVRLLHAS